MGKIINQRLKSTSTILILILGLTISCVPVNKLKYFNDIDELQEPVVNPREQKLIMPFDIVYIRIFSIDEKTNQLFNSNSNSPISSSPNISGNIVDENGNISYPFIGIINISGLTLEQAGVKLGEALSQYVSNATVSLKFLDGSITVMGEVQNQGIFQFSQNRLNIYEALALGGGISQYGDRKNVILIRQEGDRIIHHKLDLSDTHIAGKKYYYIQANDVIVVEPLKSSSWYNFNNNTFSTVTSSITTFIAIFTIFFLRN
jgi:polysaccharide biosynthesis/export protein